MKIYMIKTDKQCFISTCNPIEWGSTYAKSHSLNSLIFDGEYAKPTYLPEWFTIDKYPNKIEKKEIEYKNRKYILKEDYKGCEAFPNEINYDDRFTFDHNINDFYNYVSDKEEVVKEVEGIEIEVITQIENFELPTIDYIAYGMTNRNGYFDKKYKITNKDIKHQLIDKIMFPNVMLASKPCKFTSKQMYDITRAYIKENINSKYARISSDYDFCFEVNKKIKMYSPEEITYYNIFAKTKKERNKPHKSIQKYREVSIFKMTHDLRKYENYPIIEGLYAKNEMELKEKVDTWLQELINIINDPLTECPHCKGTGVVEDIKEIDCNDK